jgi:hypothetical protein
VTENAWKWLIYFQEWRNVSLNGLKLAILRDVRLLTLYWLSPSRRQIIHCHLKLQTGFLSSSVGILSSKTTSWNTVSVYQSVPFWKCYIGRRRSQESQDLKERYCIVLYWYWYHDIDIDICAKTLTHCNGPVHPLCHAKEVIWKGQN